MTVRYSTGLRKMWLGDNTLTDKSFREIFLNGVIYCFAGVQPSDADADATGYTYLGSATENGGAFAFGSPTNGITWGNAALDATSKQVRLPITDNLILVGAAAGTVGWGRLMGNATDNLGASQTLPRIDFSIGVTSGDARISPSTTIVVSGQYPLTLARVYLPFQV